MKRTILAALAMVVITTLGTSANAISLRFKFKVFSSGPSIYACNAGISHIQTDKKVCYFEGSQTACTDETCTSGICNTRCICASTGGGQYLMDYMNVTTMDWKDNGDTTNSNVVRHNIRAESHSTAWAQPHTDTDAWAKRIKELSFNLGSELYGASYFVDICYRGPQMEYYADSIQTNFSLLAQASATDFLQTSVNPGDNSQDGLVIPGLVDGKKYSELADLQVRAYTVCDLQGAGTYVYAHAGSTANIGTYNTTTNEANFVYSSGLPTGGKDAYFSSNPADNHLGASVIELINGYITSNASTAPRFCKTRYVFSENNVNATLPNMRKWQRHGAEMCTYTRINEDLVRH